LSPRAALQVSDLPLPVDRARKGWPWTEGSPPLAPTRPDGSPWPRISIVTPSYNQGAYLEETIRSVLLQGYPDLQYQVIDGGSTDESLAILQRYASHLDHWCHEKDGGQSDAINTGLARADGEIFGWLNSDDVYAPGALAKVARAFMGHDVDWVAGACRWRFPNAPDEVKAALTDRPIGEWLESIRIHQPASLWRLSLHERLGPIDASLHYVMDQDLFLRFLLAGVRPLEVADELALFRVHDNSKTGGGGERSRAEMLGTITPRYYRSLASQDRPVARRIIAGKYLRQAQVAFSRTCWRAAGKNLIQSALWHPPTLLSRSAAFAWKSLRPQ
jgi:glycosyltransferase involved in cell wall biosynthesis